MAPFSFIDLFTIVGTICLVWITVFLCWAIFEIARLVRQANQMVGETRHKFQEIGEKLASVGKYFSFIAVALKQIQSYFEQRKKKRVKKTMEENT